MNVTVASTYRDDSGTIQAFSETVEADETIQIFRKKIDVGMANVRLYADIDASRVLAIVMAVAKSAQKASSTGTVGLSVYTNDVSGGAPDDTFTLSTSNGVVWSSSSWASNPLTADVTSFYVTNTGDVACDLTIRVALDLEPEVSSSSSSSSTSSVNSSSSSSSNSSSSSSSASSASSQSSSSSSSMSASSNSSSSSSSQSLSSESSASESSASGA